MHTRATLGPGLLTLSPKRVIASVATAETLCGFRSSRSRLTAPDQPLRSACRGDKYTSEDEIGIDIVYT